VSIAARVAARYLGRHVATNGSILVHTYGDGTYVEVTTSPEILPASGSIARVTLPNGDDLVVAASLDALKTAYPDGMDDEVKEALFNEGLIQADDEGNYQI